MFKLSRTIFMLLTSVLLFGSSLTLAQSSYTVNVNGTVYQSNDLQPLDPALRVGELENGLTYYIRQNKEPENRARFGLVVDAGSLLEEDDQQGVAHFLEHMLFNGTESFSGTEIDDFIENAGMKDGTHLNAYTNFTETVYFLELPMDDPKFVDTGIKILQEWASAATLEIEEIDLERGVIVEEERLRYKNLNGRLLADSIPFNYGESRFTERLPIGKVDIIENAPREAFVRFYDTWYRPNLMAVIAVGDFNVDEIEKQIKDSFSGLENPEDSLERTEYSIPYREGTHYLTFKDSEFPYVLARITFTNDTEVFGTVDDYREFVKGALFSDMFSMRLEERGREADTPFLASWFSSSKLSRTANQLDFAFVTEENQEAIEMGFKGMFEEINRASEFGFTQGELDRAKENLLTGYKQSVDQLADRDSSSFVAEYIRLHLENEASPGIAFENDLVKELLPTITVDDFSDIQEKIISRDNRGIAILAPDKEGLELPTESELVAIIESVQSTEVEAYEDEIGDTELFTADLKPLKSSDVSYNSMLDIFSFTLDNGITVHFKETDFTPEEVSITASSSGGLSLLEDGSYLEGAYINSILSDSGVADFDANQLVKVLTGENVGVEVNISDYSEGFSGSAATEDLERLFQLIYLNITEPRKDNLAFQRFTDQFVVSLENRDENPQAAFSDAVTKALYGDNVRFKVPSIQDVENIDFDKAFEVYQERMASLDDLTVIVVGDTSLEDIRELSEVYLANIPMPAETETIVNRLPTQPVGVVKEKVYKGLEEQSAVYIEFNNAFDASLKNRAEVVFTSEVMNIMASDILREELGGVYTVRVRPSIQFEPYERFTFSVNFGADPERVDELIEAIFGIIEELRLEGPSEETLAKVIEQRKRNHEERITENWYWSYILNLYYSTLSEDDPAEILNLPELYESVTAQDIQNVAKVYLDPQNYVQVVLYPEAYENQ